MNTTNGLSYVHDPVGATKILTDWRTVMSDFTHHIGIDISALAWDAAVFKSPAEPVRRLGSAPNTLDGYSQFQKKLNAKGITKDNAIFCIEATGVYSELLCYQLYKSGYQVCLESPLKVKRAFAIKAHKTDPIDAEQIAEYAYRYCDRMIRWQPKPKIINHLDNWLTLREQLVNQRTAMLNFDKAINKKFDAAPQALEMCQKVITFLEQQLKDIEDHIDTLIQEEPRFQQEVERLDAIPGIGKLTAVNLVTLMRKHPQLAEYTKAAAYIGICPYKRESGTSVHKPARISHLGPPRIRKLLHLCARSVCVHNQQYKAYYLRKQREGKAKKLIINNVANKLLRVACALMSNNKPYIENYVSIHPKFI